MPAVRLALTCGSGDFKGYVAVAAYYVDLPRGSNDGSAMRADVLDAAILTGAAPAFNGRGRFAPSSSSDLVLIWSTVLRLAVISFMPGC